MFVYVWLGQIIVICLCLFMFFYVCVCVAGKDTCDMCLFVYVCVCVVGRDNHDMSLFVYVCLCLCMCGRERFKSQTPKPVVPGRAGHGTGNHHCELESRVTIEFIALDISFWEYSLSASLRYK